MFIENRKKSEGRFKYKSWWTHAETECKVIIDKRDKETRVIFFQKYGQEGTSPTNCYEDLATLLYKEQLSKEDIKSIKWYLYYIEAKRIIPFGDLIHEYQLCGRAMFHMVMDWEDSKLKNPKFNPLSEERIINILDPDDLSYDLFYS